MKGNIEFRDITFGYNRMHAEPVPVIRNFSCKVNSGQIVAVIGPTGAGKTSLVSLLLRFYDPWKGNIYIDGIDIADMKLSSLREGISLVLQDAFIFPVSIAENIGFGDPEATLDQIMEAAKAAEAHDFIMRLPDGYQSIVSEGGVSLSGGEKQRISLARALLRKSPILILDEPTSALDMKTESKIFSALSEYARDKTVFIITHRLATIKHADLIITIKDGVLAESGTHDSLLENNRVYADLYKFYN